MCCHKQKKFQEKKAEKQLLKVLKPFNIKGLCARNDNEGTYTTQHNTTQRNCDN